MAFTQEWKDETNEHAEAKSFWNDFFDVFGISRRRVATFEHKVTKAGGRASSMTGVCGNTGFIDLLWKGVILVEHKSRGRSLDKAFQQAKDYFPGLSEKELPRYILPSDFERFTLYDLDEDTENEFPLSKFQDYVHLFGFIAGYQKRTYKKVWILQTNQKD
ncbi:MAG: type IIL restriction-modification enzyme MmeI [Ginsengibacter sp.]